jgi:hypothetical protein
VTTAGELDRTIVVGAGIAGLACARALADAGRRVTVLERARGVGGRCATRRIREQPIDFGVLFYHGSDPGFLAALDAVPAEPIHGWPRVIQGAGRPCQPQAFAPGERRVAFAEGVSAFPKHLARGLDMKLGVRVVSFEVEGGAVRLLLEGGETLAARDVVLALAAEQALSLFTASPASLPAIAGARELLAMVRSQPCLALIALYPHDAPEPAWDAIYPEESPVLQLVAHDSRKRQNARFRALVYQAHARFSREHLGDERWADALLDEAARLLGPWAAAPLERHAHRWRYARTDLGAELAAPLCLSLPGGARLGVAGELFAPGGGVQAAWVSGQSLARRFLAEEMG